MDFVSLERAGEKPPDVTSLKPLPVSRPVTAMSVRSDMTTGSSVPGYGRSFSLRRALCDDNPNTKAGRRLQMARVLLVLLVPTVGVLAYAAQQLSNSITLQKDLTTLRVQLLDSHSIGELLHSLQLEREQVVFSMATNSTFHAAASLHQVFLETNSKLDDVQHWPKPLESQDHFDTKPHFQIYLQERRDDLDSGKYSILEGIVFYNGIIKVFIVLLTTILIDTTNGGLWSLLIAYKMLLGAGEHYGVTMTIGLEYYLHCNVTPEERFLFTRNDALGKYHINNVMIYAPFLGDYYMDQVYVAGGLEESLETTRYDLYHETATNCSLSKAVTYFDDMIVFMDILKEMQYTLEDALLKNISNLLILAAEDVIISISIFIVILILAPFLITMVHRMTAAVQAFAHEVAEKSHQLESEKKRADKLLFTMLPKEVATALKNKTPVKAQYYDDVTIYFSDIVGFTKLSSISSPMQIVEFLNVLYNFFDGKIERYDVYKVETIGDAYMVASGLPTRNGRRHAGEISSLALDLLEGIGSFVIPHLTTEKLRLRVGLHTGRSKVLHVLGSLRKRTPSSELDSYGATAVPCGK